MKLLNITLLFAAVLLSCNGGKNGSVEKLSNGLIEDSVLFESAHASDSIDNENWVSHNSLLDDYSLHNLESKESLRQIQWFDIPEIIKESPLDMNNLSIYNDAALFLLKNEMYNEARIILLAITEKYPEKGEVWLALGDAQWGNGDEEDARESYDIYLKLIKKGNEGLMQIPKRVYERINQDV